MMFPTTPFCRLDARPHMLRSARMVHRSINPPSETNVLRSTRHRSVPRRHLVRRLARHLGQCAEAK